MSTRSARRGLPRIAGFCVVAAAVVACGALALASEESDSQSQLERVRSRIERLEGQLGTLEQESASVRRERERLDAELELAEARVHELELVLGESRDEIIRLRDQASVLAGELVRRRDALSRHLEMIALLGRPGALQLLYDAARGGDLERAVGTVTALTAAQLELIGEYEQIQSERTSHMASLSRRLESARQEAGELELRRRQLAEVRVRVEERVEQLEKQQRRAGNELADMKARAEALERLLGLVRARRSFSGGEDIRSFRGALPWPAPADIVVGFGKHYLPKYSTYTVCNGLWLAVSSGAEVTAVFPGEVAYARHFKGYGNMVVLDHGQGVYSLVAGLAAIHVRERQRVSMGARLGVAAPPKADGNLYLEIRVGDTPQDPRRWLQLEGG